MFVASFMNDVNNFGFEKIFKEKKGVGTELIFYGFLLILGVFSSFISDLDSKIMAS